MTFHKVGQGWRKPNGIVRSKEKEGLQIRRSWGPYIMIESSRGSKPGRNKTRLQYSILRPLQISWFLSYFYMLEGQCTGNIPEVEGEPQPIRKGSWSHGVDRNTGRSQSAATNTTLPISPSAPDRRDLYNLKTLSMLVTGLNVVEKSFEDITFTW